MLDSKCENCKYYNGEECNNYLSPKAELLVEREDTCEGYEHVDHKTGSLCEQ